jgi:hypothetical protein
MKDSLPVFRLSGSEAEPAQSIDIARQLFGMKDTFQMTRANGKLSLNDERFNVETAHGGHEIWAADKANLWNPDLRPKLLTQPEALKRAGEFLATQKWLPQLEKPFRYGKPHVGGTYLARSEKGKREDSQLDVQVVYPIRVHDLPVVGGGGDFTLTMGDKGALTGLSGSWRPVVDSFEVKLLDKKLVDRKFRELTKSLQIETTNSYLAYYAPPAFSNEPYLYPVYVYEASAQLDKRTIALRNSIIPATEFGPRPQPNVPQRKRKPTVPQKNVGEKAKLRRSYHSAIAANPFEAGTSWIGESGGLGGSQANARGFVDEWRAAGWKINFNWGDANAWESDWRRNDDDWVDAADFVFYTGHADMNGWMLANPDDGSLSYTEVGSRPGSPGDLWGQNDLEWAIIAACGPLQDSILYAGGGDVLARWDGAFDGMHILMGYGGVTFDNTEEGKRVSQYAKQGNTLINSWFRAAKEIQPATNGYGAPDGPNIYVGAMWASKVGANPVNDHAWGHGSVSADPTNPTGLSAMWTLC